MEGVRKYRPGYRDERGDILVTGGAGYVGSHAVVKLLDEGYNVVVVDSLFNRSIDKRLGQPESIIRAQILAGRRLHFYIVDVCNENDLREVFNKHTVKCVMHFAGLKSVSESCSSPLTYYTNNVNGALILLKVMKEFSVRYLVFSSSATVYGIPMELPIRESHITGSNITNPYGKTKFIVEEILKDVCHAEKVWRVVSLRYFNPVGAHPSGTLGEDPLGIPNNLMPYVAQVATGRLSKLNVYGNDYETKDGTGVRDYIHIQDLCEGHIKALDKIFNGDIKGFKAYNLGRGCGNTVLEVVKAFQNVSGKRIPYQMVGRRPGDVAASYCDTTLAQEELEWSAKMSLEDMCSDMWRWQRKNPDGYRENAEAKDDKERPRTYD